MDYLIRPAILADAPPLKILLETTYRSDESRKGWTHEADLLDGERISHAALDHALTSPSDHFMVAEAHDGTIIGCTNLDFSGDETAPVFGKFAVVPNLQGQGLGKALILAAEQAAVARGAKKIIMYVIEQRGELIAYYNRRGYENTGHKIPLASFHSAPDWTIGHDLMLVQLIKQL